MEKAFLLGPRPCALSPVGAQLLPVEGQPALACLTSWSAGSTGTEPGPAVEPFSILLILNKSEVSLARSSKLSQFRNGSLAYVSVDRSLSIRLDSERAAVQPQLCGLAHTGVGFCSAR